MPLIGQNDVLLLIDPQIDFCPGGQLAVANGDAIFPAINRLAQSFHHIVLTQDWHPAHHQSFASSHPGAQPYETIQASYGSQTLWPAHCVQNTHGAAFHPALAPAILSRVELILRKGFRPEIDSYSAFLENDKLTATGLAGYLRERGFQRLYLAGLAYDYCVRFSALDAVQAGFEAIVIQDATRSVNLANSVAETQADFAAANVRQIHLADLDLT